MKRIALIVLILTAVLTITACGSKNEYEQGGHTHMFGGWITTVEASCTNSGERVRSCKCGEKEVELVEKTSHTATVIDAVEPTCAVTGLSEGLKCSVCDAILLAPSVIPALPHTEVVSPAVTASCSVEGLTEGTRCSVCNQEIVAPKSLGRLPHVEVIDAAVAASCTKSGMTEGKHCSVCHEVLVAQEVIQAPGHTEVIHPGIEATCQKAGLSDGKSCSVCGEVLAKQQEIVVSHNDTYGVCMTCNTVTNGDLAAKHYITTDSSVAEGKICTCYYNGEMFVRYRVEYASPWTYVGNAANGDIAISVSFDIVLDEVSSSALYSGRGFVTYIIMAEDIVVRSGYASVSAGRASVSCIIPVSKIFPMTVYLNVGNYSM